MSRKANDKKRKDKKIILIPEMKIKIDQEKKTKSVWPISGWTINSKATHRVIKKENEYFK